MFFVLVDAHVFFKEEGKPCSWNRLLGNETWWMQEGPTTAQPLFFMTAFPSCAHSTPCCLPGLPLTLLRSLSPPHPFCLRLCLSVCPCLSWLCLSLPLSSALPPPSLPPPYVCVCVVIRRHFPPWRLSATPPSTPPGGSRAAFCTSPLARRCPPRASSRSDRCRLARPLGR